MADEMRKLLDHIVRTFLVHDDLVAIDQEASANERGDAIDSEKRRAMQREIDLADELSDALARVSCEHYPARMSSMIEMSTRIRWRMR